MGTIYVDTGGATTNSGSTDNNAASLSGTNATVVGSVITLDGSPDLTGVVTSGATQSTIYLAQATNSNQKIFWITAADNGAKTVTVSVAPTGVTGSNWAIGGRFVWTPASIEGALRAGDLVTVNNSIASSASTVVTERTAGSSSGGFIKMIGKSGSRPTITHSSTSNCIAGSATASLWWVENLELIQQGASGNALSRTGSGNVIYNVKISDAGGVGISNTNSDNNTRIIACEISGCGGDGINDSGNDILIGNYVHDVTGDGYEHNQNNGSAIFIRNIFDTCAARGIYFPGAATVQTSLFIFDGNTVYGCGNTGLEVADTDYSFTMLNNIFAENGNAAGEYNVEWTAGTAELVSFHAWNLFYSSGGGGSANLSGLTAGAQVSGSELTTDPAFTNAASGDFSIGSSSPAKAVGFPGAFLGGTSTGYLDMGAVQRQESASGGLAANPLRGFI